MDKDFSPIVRAAVDKNRCIGCGQCVQVCPLGAIDIEEKAARVDQNICIPCGNCIRVCPQDAIGWDLEGLSGQVKSDPERIQSLQSKLSSLNSQLMQVKKKINQLLKKG